MFEFVCVCDFFEGLILLTLINGICSTFLGFTLLLASCPKQSCITMIKIGESILTCVASIPKIV